MSVSGTPPHSSDNGDDLVRRAIFMNEPTTPTADESPPTFDALSVKYVDIPEDQKPYADKVLQMHPYDDVPAAIGENRGPAQGAKMAPMTVKALPHEKRSEVYRRLELLPNMPKEERAKYESQYVAETIRAMRPEIRRVAGVGNAALPYHKEQNDIEVQLDDLKRKRDYFQSEIKRVRGYDTSVDPVTGKKSPKGIPALSRVKREAYAQNVMNLTRDINLLVRPDGSYGSVAQRRLQKALAESASLLHERSRVLEEEQAAQKLASENARQARIEERAEMLAKIRGNSPT